MQSLERQSIASPEAAHVLADHYEEIGALDEALALRRVLSGEWDWSIKPTKTRLRIDKMTAAESAQMDAFAKQWIAIGLKSGATSVTDKRRFACAINDAYRATNLDLPKRIVWTTSPIAMVLAGPIAACLLRDGAVRSAVGSAVDGAVDGAVGSAVRDAVSNAVSSAVRDAVSNAVSNAVDGAVGSAVRDAVGGAVDGAVRDAVSGAVGDAVSRAVYGAVGGAVSGAVGDAVRDAVGDAVGSAVSNAVSRAVGGAVDGAVGDAVGGAVRDAVRDAVGDAVGSAVRGAVHDAAGDARLTIAESWYAYIGGQPWVGWGYGYRGPAYVAFMHVVLRLRSPDAIDRAARAYRAICQTCWWLWPHRDYVVVAPRPQILELDQNRRLVRAEWDDGSAVVRQADGRYSLNVDVARVLDEVLR